jgi:biotin carboxylase
MPGADAKRVLVLATTTGYQIRSFGDAARALGVRLVFVSDRCDQLEDPWWDQAIPVRFRDAEEEAERVAAALGGTAIDGVIAVGDRPTILAAHLARRLGLPGNPPAAADASRNKLAAREIFRRAGLPTPAFTEVPPDGDLSSLAAGLQYPVVVKPLALSGSRGVIRADSAGALHAAVERVRRLLRSPDVQAQRDALHERVLVESFIPGREYAVEALLTEGVLQGLAIFDKPDPLDGPFFEETLYVTPSRAPGEVQEQIETAVRRAVAALGLHHGPIHAECRVNDEGVWMLEVAARPIGGLCSRALHFTTDATAQHQSLEELLLRHAVGDDVSRYRREADASAVMMIPIAEGGIFKGVDGVDLARQVSQVDDVVITAKLDSRLVPLPEGRSYLGFIFARAASASDAERAVRAAHARLHFHIGRALPVV